MVAFVLAALHAKQPFVTTLILAVSSSVVLSFLDDDEFDGLEDGDDMLANWFHRFYFVCTTLSTVGYGDISPKSVRARVVVTFLLFLILTDYSSKFTEELFRSKEA